MPDCRTCNALIEKDNTYHNIYIALEQAVLRLNPTWNAAPLKDVCVTCLKSMLHDTTKELTAIQSREQLYSVVPPGSAEYEKIAALVHGLNIYRIEKNYNERLLREFEAATTGQTKETRYMFHGSAHHNYMSILSGGFDIKRSGNGSLGYGIYFAKDPHYSLNYTKGVQVIDLADADSLVNMIVARVAITNDTKFGSDILCVPNDRHCYPEYVIYFKM